MKLSETDRVQHIKNSKRAYEARNKEVVANRKRAWFDQNPDYLRSYYVRNRATYLLKMAQRRAKKASLAFNITIEDVVIPEICPVLNIPIRLDSRGGFNPNSPSLDRIIDSLGYVKGNVKVISNRANLLKRDAEAWELIRVANYITKETARVEQELAG